MLRRSDFVYVWTKQQTLDHLLCVNKYQGHCKWWPGPYHREMRIASLLQISSPWTRPCHKCVWHRYISEALHVKPGSDGFNACGVLLRLEELSPSSYDIKRWHILIIPLLQDYIKPYEPAELQNPRCKSCLFAYPQLHCTLGPVSMVSSNAYQKVTQCQHLLGGYICRLLSTLKHQHGLLASRINWFHAGTLS